MNRNKTWAAGLIALAFFAMTGVASADTNPANDFDALTITITPNVDIGVDITTGAVVESALSLTLAPGATGYTTHAASVTVIGNMQPQEWDVQGTALNTWQLDTDEEASNNDLQLYALFAVNRASAPIESDFAGTGRLVTGAVQRAGGSSGNGTQFEHSGMTGTTDVDSMSIGAQKQLWFRMDAPPTTSVSTDQKFRITITATTTSI